jgi:hypothetical protein
MYFTRLVRPLWKDKLIKPGYKPELLYLTLHILTAHRSLGLQQSNFGDKLLVTVQKNLFASKGFLDKTLAYFTRCPESIQYRGHHLAMIKKLGRLFIFLDHDILALILSTSGAVFVFLS